MLEMATVNFNLQDSYNDSVYGIYKNKLQEMKTQITQCCRTVMLYPLVVILKQDF